MPPTVSVVMPVYNGERYLAEAIASVLGQTFANVEFIIVDDGSTDNSVAIMQEYAGRDKRIRCIPLGQNQGAAAARNKGIAAARGRYLAMLDSDDICLPHRLSKQVDYLETNPRIDVVGCTMWVTNHGLEPEFCFTVPERHTEIVWNLFFGWGLAGASTMIRRDLLDELGGYDVELDLVYDLELWTRLAGSARFANLLDTLMLYRRHELAGGLMQINHQRKEVADVMARRLTSLWGEAPEATVERFIRVRKGAKDFRRAERNLLRIEMTRLIESFVGAGWVQADERPLLQSAMESELRRIRPRRRHFWKRLL